MSGFELWLIIVVSGLKAMLFGVGLGVLIFSSIFAGLCVLIAIDVPSAREWAKNSNIYLRVRRLIIVCIIGMFASCLCPTKKDFIAIYTIPVVTNNEEISKLPDNILTFVNNYLEKEIDNNDR